MSILKVILALTVLTAGSVSLDARQIASPSTLPIPHGTMPGSGGADNGPFAASTQEHLERGRQTDRQRRMIADTDRLLTLATELKADMDKTTKDQLSIDVIKKAEEIEKLAKSVKDRMKG